MSVYNETQHAVYMMEISFVLLEGEGERPTDQVIASMANLIRADSFQLEFFPFRAKFLALQAAAPSFPSSPDDSVGRLWPRPFNSICNLIRNCDNFIFSGDIQFQNPNNPANSVQGYSKSGAFYDEKFKGQGMVILNLSD
jgi:hypothetical protein